MDWTLREQLKQRHLEKFWEGLRKFRPEGVDQDSLFPQEFGGVILRAAIYADWFPNLNGLTAEGVGDLDWEESAKGQLVVSETYEVIMRYDPNS